MHNIYFSIPEVISAAGSGSMFLDNILSGKSGITFSDKYINNTSVPLGVVKDLNVTINDLPQRLQVEEFNTRAVFMLMPLLVNLCDKIEYLKKKYGSHRIGVSFGTTNPGMEENLDAMHYYIKTGDFSKYSIHRNSLYNPARFCSLFYNIHGPAFTISTACTSGVKSIIQGYRLIQSGLCDAVICGGSDSLNSLTVNGFNNLQILSNNYSNPFSKNRDGVNLGEASVLFLLTKEPEYSNVRVKSFASNNDAFHITKQDPESPYAVTLLEDLKKGMAGESIDYINLHATGTIPNDQVESYAVKKVFGSNTLCSGIKQLTGHTLGVAGSLEAALCVMLVNKQNTNLPPHIYYGEYDESLAKIHLVAKEDRNIYKIKNAASINFAFGGDNSAIAVGYD